MSSIKGVKIPIRNRIDFSAERLDDPTSEYHFIERGFMPMSSINPRITGDVTKENLYDQQSSLHSRETSSYNIKSFIQNQQSNQNTDRHAMSTKRSNNIFDDGAFKDYAEAATIPARTSHAHYVPTVVHQFATNLPIESMKDLTETPRTLYK